MISESPCWFLDTAIKEHENLVLTCPDAKIAVLCGHSQEYAPLARHTIYKNKAEYCKRHGYDLHVVLSVRYKYIDPQSHASGFSWSRLEEMLELVQGNRYEWVWCVGADTLITNMTITLESIIATAETPRALKAPFPKPQKFSNSPAPSEVIHWNGNGSIKGDGRKHLLICGECLTSMQADSFLIRCGKIGANYIKDILAQYELYKHHIWVENQTMIDLRDKYASITHMVPGWMLNAYDYSRWYHVHPRFHQGKDCYGNRADWQPGDFLIHWPAASLQQRLDWLPKYERQIVYE